MNKLSLVFLVFGVGALGSQGCQEKYGPDCRKADNCPGDGDGDLGGSASGGAGDGDGDGDTGGASSTACEPECTGDTPICDEDAETCVECLETEDCEEGLCDTESNTCVACLENTDCTEVTASLCDSGTCSSCTQDDDCAHLTDTAACDTDAGTCVECTAENESACGDNSCNPATNTCTTTPTGSLEACESCVADSECEADHFCVPMTFQSEERGGYCLKTNSGGCDQPYSIDLSGRTTLSGESGHIYCGINEALATCEAVFALMDNQTCNGPTDCPEGGLCRKVGSLVGNRCTYECSGPVQCDESPNPGSTCGPGVDPDPVTPDYCGGQD